MGLGEVDRKQVHRALVSLGFGPSNRHGITRYTNGRGVQVDTHGFRHKTLPLVAVQRMGDRLAQHGIVESRQAFVALVREA